MNNNASVDPTKLNRSLVQALLFVIAVFASFFAIKRGSPLFMAGLIALPFVLMLLEAPRLTLVMSVILNATQLPLPGKIASTQLGFMGFALLAGMYCLGTLMGAPQWKSELDSRSRTIFKVYVGWLIILMAIHGTGLKILGSETWGGTRYIANFIAIMLCFVLSGLRVGRKHISWIIYGSIIAGLFGSFLKWKGYSATVEEGGFRTEMGEARLQFLLPFILAYFPFVFAIPLGRFKWLRMPLVFMGFMLVGLTGFRSRILSTGATIIMFTFLRSKAKGLYIAMLSIILCVCWGGAVLVAPHLPQSMQRAISFVPGANVTNDAALDAEGSVDWRVQIWTYCLDRADEYWLLGKGLAFNVYEVIGQLSRGDIFAHSPWFAYQTHAYHSGPLTLFIDLGLPGLIIFVMISIMILKKMWGYVKRLSRFDTPAARFALFNCCYLFYSTIHFYVIYGDFNKMAELVIWFAVFSVLAVSVLDELEAENPMVAEPLPDPASSDSVQRPVYLK